MTARLVDQCGKSTTCPKRACISFGYLPWTHTWRDLGTLSGFLETVHMVVLDVRLNLRCALGAALLLLRSVSIGCF